MSFHAQIQAKIDQADSVVKQLNRAANIGFDLTEAVEAIAAVTGPVQAAWNENIEVYYECVWDVYEANLA